MPAAMSAPAPRASRSKRAPRASRSRLVGLLIIGPLLCAIALTGLAYVGLTQQATRDTLAQMGVAAQAAHGALQANMGDLKVTNGQLTSSLPANVMTLNNNLVEAQRLHDQVGVHMLIAQREQGVMVVVASSLAPAIAGGAPAGLGERLSGGVATNACATSMTAPTTGTLTIAGSDYLSGSAPLVDGSGACVGAIVAVTPVSALRSASLAYTVIVAMAGAFLALLTAVIGLALHGRDSGREQEKRVGVALAAVEQSISSLAAQMAERERADRRLTTGRRHLQRLLATIANDRLTLQETTSDIWAGVSHPGAPVDPRLAMRLARESAVVAARVASRLDDVDAVTSALVADLEASEEVDMSLSEALAHTSDSIAEMRSVLGGEAPDTGATSAAPIAKRSAPDAVDPFATNLLAAQRGRTSESPSISPESAPRQTGGYRAVRADSSQRRAVSDRGATGKTPAAGQSVHGQSLLGRTPGSLGASGVHRQQNLGGASGRHSAGPFSPPPRLTPQPNPRPAPKPTPRPNVNMPRDGRDRDSSGSRWLND